MKKVVISCALFLFIPFVSAASTGSHSSGTQKWNYDSTKLRYTGSTVSCGKDLQTGEKYYTGANIKWTKQKNGNTIYTTATTRLEKNSDFIKYTTPGITYENKNGVITYKTATTSLIISKDKIIYTTPTTTREIDGGDWKYATPTTSYGE